MEKREEHMAEKEETAKDPQELEKQDKKPISEKERTESPDQDFLHQPRTSLSEDGAIEPKMEDFNSSIENDLNGEQGKDWPPEPELEEDYKKKHYKRKEDQVIEIQDWVKDNIETSQDVQQDTEGENSFNMTQMGEGTDSPNLPVTSEEQMHFTEHELESQDDSNSVVLLSENSEEQNIDYKPVDFATTKEQWVRRDSRIDEPPNLVEWSKISSTSLIKHNPSQSTQSQSIFMSDTVQQGELDMNIPRALNENEVVQQVCGAASPLDTVAGEPANPEQGSPACSSTEVKEPLIMTEGGRDIEREERERGETGEERKQTVCVTETSETKGERQGKIKDQGQERDNKGQRNTDSKPNTYPHLGEGRVNRMDFDDSQSDSGLSADFSPSSTTDVSDCPVNVNAPELFESPTNETPIEREIRLAMKREQSLRRSRGLDSTTDRTNEFVEIPARRPILSKDLLLKPNPSQGKDRQFAGKKMQQEISVEAEREKVLVELGRLPGFYDKGTEVQLQEKRQLFEAFQEPKESVPFLSRRSNSINVESSSGILEVDPTLEIRQSQNSPTPTAITPQGGSNSNRPASRGPGLTEGIKGQIIIIEASNSIPTTVGDSNGSLRSSYNTVPWTDGGSMKVMHSESVRSSSAGPVRTSPRQNLKVENEDDEDSITVKENPFFKLRSSMSLRPEVEQDIKEAKERERELRRQRNSHYGGAPMDVDAEREPGMDLGAKEGENMERKAGVTQSSSKEIPSPTPQHSNLNPVGHQSDQFSTTTSVQQSTRKLDLTWPPPQADEEQRQQSEKTLKIPRQRNPLLERWESGMVNGHMDNSK
ncbi:mitotic interactor and substrate of PLK1-like [Myxocyprinus asiaticus]|uniref:mitotic interactor and substrate of PLK1-like n=1 Tax=Myxocyprinus asiaticus TaxID=70543 RepID=UPI00222216A0|nr:mitotic interactor and substrate of PLK1-like [Myxocyprinus asiaticus]